MLIQVRRDARDLDAWTSTEWGFAETFMRYRGERLRLEPYQQRFLQERSRYRYVVKARQVGYSWLFAVEALARCHLLRNFTAILVSYNLADAVEKITVARELYEEMAGPWRKRLVTDSKTELAFESTGTGRRGRTRIVSVPSKAPRGKHGTVYLDELAHYQDARRVYSGTTATIMRSKGQLTVASTPLGRRGLFWEIAARDAGRYGHFSRQFVPWWACRFFAPEAARAALEAPELSTEERVGRFASAELRAQLESLDRLHFRQELECAFLSEGAAFFPYDLILGCMSDDVVLADDWTDVPRPKGRLVAGYDVGRMRDRSELALFEDEGGRFTCRALRRFEDTPFAAQEAELRRMLDVLPIARLSIDRGGIGMNLAENLERDYPQVVPETFSPTAKERWATDLKILLQRRDVELPLDRELLTEVHTIERRVSPSGRPIFEAPKSAKGHADRFWAIAMACQREREEEDAGGGVMTARVIGAPSREEPDYGALVEPSGDRREDDRPAYRTAARAPLARPRGRS